MREWSNKRQGSSLSGGEFWKLFGEFGRGKSWCWALGEQRVSLVPEATPLSGRLLANCLFPETLLMGLRAWETDRGAQEERVLKVMRPVRALPTSP